MPALRMIVVDSFAGRRVAILGLARSGRAAAEALAAGGAEILAWDDDPAVRDAVAGEIPLGNLAANADWRQIGAALVLSPGIPHSHPEPHPAVLRAREAGSEIIGDIELLGRARPAARYVGITGTNGKSTTTALIGHILTAAGQRVEIGGNLGTSALALAPLGPDGTYVLEASSFQLELISSLAFDVAVLLNITPDHLDRHGGMDGYIAAKRRIFARQGAASTAIVGIDDAICRGIAARTCGAPAQARVVPISVNERPPVASMSIAAGSSTRPAGNRLRCSTSRSPSACPVPITGRTPLPPMPPRARSGSRPKLPWTRFARSPVSRIGKSW